MIFGLIATILLAMLVMMAGFYFLNFVRKENFGKTHVVIGYTVVVFSMLVIACSFVGIGVRAAIGGACHGNSEKCGSYHKGHGEGHGSCPMMMGEKCHKGGMCEMGGGSCSMKGGSCEMGGHDCMKEGMMSGCKMGGKECSGDSKCSSKMKGMMMEKEVSIDDDGNKTIQIEVTK